jgi:signal transduction histidine kinase/CheY-like chemotaxis protein
LLVLAVLVPGGIFAVVLFTQYYSSEVRRTDEELQGDARKLALSIDRDLLGQQHALQTLSIARLIVNRDYEGFYNQALKIRDITGVNILLRDLSGQQLINTRVPWGTPLPRDSVEGDDEVLTTKRPYISDLIMGTVARRPLYTITVPVLDGDHVAYFLHLSLELQSLLDLLRENVGPDRSAAILDRHFRYLRRTDNYNEYVGNAAPQSFIEAVTGNTGFWRGTDTDGHAVRAAYVKSTLGGWWVWVSVPAAVVQSSLRDILWKLALLGAALAGSALILANYIGGRLAGSARTLAAQAVSLGRDDAISRRQLPVRELDETGEALVAASISLRQRGYERDEAERALRQLSETLEGQVSERTHDLQDEMQRRKEAEDALRQAQKMEAIGQLTGGIAHDFNNMLAIILGSLELALRRLVKGDAPIEKYLLTAQEGGRRAASLTQRLLAFSRQQPLQPQSVDGNKLVSELSELLRRSLGEMIKLETVLAGGLWRISVDGNQLESAILNLAVNARDAMSGAGKLTIETANAHLDDKYAAGHAVSAGQYVLIAVTDTGAGMTRDVIEKAFDPFFTTKKGGDGTGLGLSQVYGFVKQSGGHVKIYSEVGHGTIVKIYLPRFYGSDAPNDARIERASLLLNDGNATVLVVEDEDGMRDFASDAFRELGYRVLQAASGPAALELIDSHSEIDLLFTDVVMPDMNGRRLSEQALQRRPSMKVLFTTGYTRNAIVHNGMLDPDVQLLAKPFTLEELASKVAEVMKDS